MQTRTASTRFDRASDAAHCLLASPSPSLSLCRVSVVSSVSRSPGRFTPTHPPSHAHHTRPRRHHSTGPNNQITCQRKNRNNIIRSRRNWAAGRAFGSSSGIPKRANSWDGQAPVGVSNCAGFSFRCNKIAELYKLNKSQWSLITRTTRRFITF